MRPNVIDLPESAAVLQIMTAHRCSLPHAAQLVQDLKAGKLAAVFLTGGKFIKFQQ